jgi:hypothetical protein
MLIFNIGAMVFYDALSTNKIYHGCKVQHCLLTPNYTYRHRIFGTISHLPIAQQTLSAIHHPQTPPPLFQLLYLHS